MLEALGVSADEEEVYRVIVGGYRSNTADVALALGKPVGEVAPLLAALQRKYLISRSGEYYVPAPPDVSLGPLLLRGQTELQQARDAVAQLTERYRGSARQRDAAQLVQIVTGSEAIRQQALHLQRTAEREMLWFCRKGPIAMPPSENHEEIRALERGVRYRVVYESALLEEPGMIASTIEGIRAGENARSLSTLPVRLAVADGSIALCPLAEDAAGEPTAALVRNSSLLSALIALFESYWERGTPVRIDGSASGGPLGTAERKLLSLLVGGVSDKSIATQLQISQRTVQRRLQELMQRAKAQSRTQLAWQAGKLGWLDDCAEHLLTSEGGPSEVQPAPGTVPAQRHGERRGATGSPLPVAPHAVSQRSASR